MSATPIHVWMTPTISALFLYGIGQGLVKKFISEVPPARFCLYFVAAKALVNIGYFLTHEHPALSDPAGFRFLAYGFAAYVLDGGAWVLYFLSIVHGPITIIGTVSAAYPAITVLLARIFLGESLSPLQYAGVSAVILGSLGLTYEPGDASTAKSRKWIPLAGCALVVWGAASTLSRYAYSLPSSSESSMALLNTLGGLCTLGVFGILAGAKRSEPSQKGEWIRSFVPMGMMAGGDLMVIVALASGPASIVTPVSGAYPVVTLAFAAVALKEKITKLQWFLIGLILFGIFASPGQG